MADRTARRSDRLTDKWTDKLTDVGQADEQTDFINRWTRQIGKQMDRRI